MGKTGVSIVWAVIEKSAWTVVVSLWATREAAEIRASELNEADPWASYRVEAMMVGKREIQGSEVRSEDGVVEGGMEGMVEGVVESGQKIESEGQDVEE